MGDRRQVQYGVGRTADAHIHRNGILKRLTRQDVPWLDVLLQQLHDHCACALCKQQAGTMIGRRNRSVARKCHAKRLRQAVHGIRREKTRAGTASGARMGFQIRHLSLVHLACCELARSFKGLAHADVAPMESPCQHGTAAHNNARNVQPCRCHEHARHDLVAVRDQHQRIKARCHSHSLNGVRDKFPACQRILHARMSHRNAVTDTDGREFHRCPACRCHPQLCRLRDGLQMHVPRNDLIERIANADQRLLQFLRAKTIRVEQGSVRTACRTLFDNIASHIELS